MDNSFTIKNSISLIKKELYGLYPDREIQSFIYIIFENLFNYTKIKLHLNSDTKLTHSSLQQINEIISQLKKFIPIQYIFEESDFFGLKFKVTPDVLIPRQETEELIQWILDAKHAKNSSFIDIGTGSGCIAITLAKMLPNSIADAIDISPEALSIAEINTKKNKTNVNFYHADILNIKTLIINKKYDLIVSNPPYVKEEEKEEMQKNVLDHEPHTALFVKDNNALIFYRAIIDFALLYLKKMGYIYFEVNEKLALEVKNILIERGFTNIEIKKDINERDRMVRGQFS